MTRCINHDCIRKILCGSYAIRNGWVDRYKGGIGCVGFMDMRSVSVVNFVNKTNEVSKRENEN